MSTREKDPLLGRTIAQRYRLIAKLGDGGRATAYLARHVLIEHLSAIKFLRTDIGSDEDARERFVREARAVNRINHPSIVEITDYGETEGLVYLVMEYVPGESLGKHLEDGPLGFRRAARIGLQIASALGRAHEMGVVHGDLRPEHVLIIAQRSGGDLVKLTHFGVAKMQGAPAPPTPAIALGKPAYCAPECRGGGGFDVRSDLFSFGVLLYEITSGELPWGEHPTVLCEPPRLATKVPDVPAFFDDIVMTLLADNPDDRPRDAFEVHDLLKRVLDADTTRRERASPAGSGTEADPARVAEREEPAPRRRKPAPALATLPVDRVGPICAGALAQIEASAAAAGALPSATLLALGQARKQGGMLVEIAHLVAADSEAIETEQARGRAVRLELGRRLDEQARDRSKALGWAGTIAERSDQVRTRRASGVQPVHAVEAMVWEQAALDQEEEQTRARADTLSEQMLALQGEIERQNERLEHVMLVATARLEGHIAALRSMALETWMSLEEVARRLGITLAIETETTL